MNEKMSPVGFLLHQVRDAVATVLIGEFKTRLNTQRSRDNVQATSNLASAQDEAQNSNHSLDGNKKGPSSDLIQ